MPMVKRGFETLVSYPDGESKVITLYVQPAEGQIIAHGWEVTSVTPSDETSLGATVAYRISVVRPAGS